MAATYIQCKSGACVDFAALLAGERQDIRLSDIAWGLAGCSRFAAQGALGITVAEHSLMAAQVARNDAWLARQPRLPLVMLLHDAHEAYTGDLPSPLKALLRAEGGVYDDITYSLDRQIFEWCGMPEGLERTQQKEIDVDICLNLERWLEFRGCPPAARPWGDDAAAEAAEGLARIERCLGGSRGAIADRWLLAVHDAAEACGLGDELRAWEGNR